MSDALASTPAGEKATAFTSFVCAVRRLASLRVLLLQSMTTVSIDPLARRSGSVGDQATLRTSSECPVESIMGRGDRNVSEDLPVRHFGECVPVKLVITEPVSTLKMFTELSEDAEATAVGSCGDQ